MSTKAILTPTELVEWLKENDPIGECSAVVAFGRVQTNQLLMQEYTDRYDGALTMPSIEGTLEASDQDEWTYLGSVGYHAPVLSFDESLYTSSSARLTMRAASGVQLNLEKISYTGVDKKTLQSETVTVYQPVKLRYMSPLNGIEHVTYISLDKTIGSVTGGEVSISMQNARELEKSRFTISPYESVQQRAAQNMDRIFKAMKPETTRFVISSLKADPAAFFTPSDFSIRVLPDSLQNQEAGGGAVLLFIQADPADRVNVPDEPGTFLIPSGFSASMLLARRFMLRRILQKGIATLAEDGYKIINLTEGGEFVGMTFYDGVLKSKPFPSFEVTRDGASATVSGNTPALALGEMGGEKTEPDGLTIKFEPGEDEILVKVAWAGHQSYQVSIDGKPTGVDHDWKYAWSYRLSLDVAANDLKLERVDGRGAGSEQRSVVDVDSHPLLNEIVNGLEQVLFDEYILGSIDEALSRPVGYLNVMRLNQLLFRSDNPVELEEMHQAQGVVLFSHVSPARTRFCILTTEGRQLKNDVYIGQSLTVEIALTGGGTAKRVKWDVEGIGYSENAGSFGDDGATLTTYTAPDKLIGENFIAVRITAEVEFEGDGELYTSMKLVYVFGYAMMLGPIVQVLNSGQSRSLSLTSAVSSESVSGEMDASANVIGEALNKTQDPKYPWEYTAPLRTDELDQEEAGVDKRKGFDLRRAIFTNGYGHDVSAYFLVKYVNPDIVIRVIPELDEGNLKVLSLRAVWFDGEEVSFNNGYNPRWSSDLGEGNLVPQTDGSALYKHDSNIPAQFVVVKVKQWRSETRDDAARKKFSEQADDRRGPGGGAADPDYYGVVVIPLPWIEFDTEDAATPESAEGRIKLRYNPHNPKASTTETIFIKR